MRFGGILVIAMIALGFWVHGQRAEQSGNRVAGQVTTAAGVGQPYLPQGGSAQDTAGKVRLTGVRLLSSKADIDTRVGAQTLSDYLRRVERLGTETLRAAKPTTVLVQFASDTRSQDVQLTSQGSINGPALQNFHGRLMAMQRLQVRGGNVSFEVRLSVAP